MCGKINEIIDYLKTQRIVGDGKNIIVNQGTAGVSLQVRGINNSGGAVSSGGGGDSFVNFPVTITGDTTANLAVNIGSGTYYVDDYEYTPSGASWSLANSYNPQTIYCLYDRDMQGNAKTSFVINSGNISDPSFKGFPIARISWTSRLGRITSTKVIHFCNYYPYLSAYRMPWEVYIGNYTDGEFIGNTVDSSCYFFMQDGLAPGRLEFPITTKSWSGAPISIATSSSQILYYEVTRSDHRFFLDSNYFSNNPYYAYYREQHKAIIPIAQLGAGKIIQAQYGNFYGIEGRPGPNDSN